MRGDAHEGGGGWASHGSGARSEGVLTMEGGCPAWCLARRPREGVAQGCRGAEVAVEDGWEEPGCSGGVAGVAGRWVPAMAEEVGVKKKMVVDGCSRMWEVERKMETIA